MKYLLREKGVNSPWPRTWLLPALSPFDPDWFMGHGQTDDTKLGVRASVILERCDLASIPYEDCTHEYGGIAGEDQVWLITVPDDRDAAFRFKCFVQP